MEDGTSVHPPSTFSRPASPPTPPSEFTQPVSPPTPPSEFTPPGSPPTPPSEFTPPGSPPTPLSEFTPPVSPPTPPSEFTPLVPLFTWVDITDEESISESDSESFLSFTEHDVSVISADSDTCLTPSSAESRSSTTDTDLSASSSFIGQYAGNSPTPTLTENFIQPAEIDYLPAGAFGARDLFAEVSFIKRARDACTKEFEGTSSSIAQNELYASDTIVAATTDGDTAETLMENHAVYNDSSSSHLQVMTAKSAGVFFPTAFSLTYTYQRALQLLATYQVYGIHRVYVCYNFYKLFSCTYYRLVLKLWS